MSPITSPDWSVMIKSGFLVACLPLQMLSTKKRQLSCLFPRVRFWIFPAFS